MSDCTTSSRNTAAESPEKSPDGKWAKGNRGGPGNPFARECAEMRRLIARRCPEEKLIQITDRFIDMAIDGNLQAAKFVFSYRIGKPVPVKDPDRMDLEELMQTKQAVALETDCHQAALKSENVFLKGLAKFLKLDAPYGTLEGDWEVAEDDALRDEQVTTATHGQDGHATHDRGTGFQPVSDQPCAAALEGKTEEQVERDDCQSMPGGANGVPAPIPNGSFSPSPNASSQAQARPQNARSRSRARAKRLKKEKRNRRKAARRAARR